MGLTRCYKTTVFFNIYTDKCQQAGTERVEYQHSLTFRICAMLS